MYQLRPPLRWPCLFAWFSSSSSSFSSCDLFLSGAGIPSDSLDSQPRCLFLRLFLYLSFPLCGAEWNAVLISCNGRIIVAYCLALNASTQNEQTSQVLGLKDFSRVGITVIASVSSVPVASLNGSLDGSLDDDRIEPGVGPRPFVVTNPTSERCFSFRWSPDAGHVHCLVLREFYVHEICSTCTLDGCFSVLESPGVLKSCGRLTGVVVRVLRYFAFLARFCGHYSRYCSAFVSFLNFVIE